MLNGIEGIGTIDLLPFQGERESTAFFFEGSVVSYGTLQEQVAALAGTLLRSGLRKGDRVAAWLPKCQAALLMPLAAARCGLIYVPINPALRRAQVAHILSDCAASVLWTCEAFAATLEAADILPGCRVRLVEDEAGAAEGVEPAGGDVDAVAQILYTSGSTGRAKGVVLTNRNLWTGAMSVAGYLGLNPDDRLLAVLPLSFDYGQNQLFSAWFAGAAAYPVDYLLPRDVFGSIVAHGITTLAGVPPLFVQLTETAWSGPPISTLRRVTNSGGALTRSLIDRIRTVLRPAEIYAMYGLTEAFRSTYLKPELIDRFPESIGNVIPYAEVLVVRPDGSEADDGEEGELVHAGPLVAQGYWNNPEATAERFKPAPAGSTFGGTAVWSGDRVRREEGLLYFVGRQDAMIKTAGYRVSPGEIEEVAMASGLVADAAAFGQSDDRLGQIILLAIRAMPDEEVDVLQLQAHLARQLPTFMRPASIVVLGDFPVGPNGKLDRLALQGRLREKTASHSSQPELARS